MKNCNIPFGGFYNSLHYELINSMLESYFDFKDYDYLDIDYTVIHNEYIKKYINNLNEFLNDDFEIDVIFHNLRLDSPREYNFSTDKINCNISDLNCKKLNKIFIFDDIFIEYLKEATKNFDGYVSFYTFNEAILNKDNILIDYVFKYICNCLLDNEKYLTYYDMNNNYEMLNNLNFIRGK